MSESSRLDAQIFIAKRLKEHGAKIFTGVTDSTERKERIRSAIIGNKLDQEIIGRRADSKTETYAQCFERAFGEPLYTAEDLQQLRDNAQFEGGKSP